AEPAQIIKRDQGNQDINETEFRKSDLEAHLKLLQKPGQLRCWLQFFILPASQKVDEAFRRSSISPVDRRVRHRRDRFVKISRQSEEEHHAANRDGFPLRKKSARPNNQHCAGNNGTNTPQEENHAQNVQLPLMDADDLQITGALRRQSCKK